MGRIKSMLKMNQKKYSQFLTLLLMAVVATLGLVGCTQDVALNDAKLGSIETKNNYQVVKDSFDYPAEEPLLSKGKVVFNNNCKTCHSPGSLSYNKIRDVRPVDQYLTISRGHGSHNVTKHPVFKNLNTQQKWEAVFYYRFLAGGSAFTVPKKDVANIFGKNCAVCHGKNGFADGTLHTGHGPHELGMAPTKNNFQPAPANFHDFPRFYNRTDDQLVMNVSQGLYPSAMPSWLGRQDKVNNYTFDENLIRELIFYIREFSYRNDLPDEEQLKSTFPKAGVLNTAQAKAQVEHGQ